MLNLIKIIDRIIQYLYITIAILALISGIKENNLDKIAILILACTSFVWFFLWCIEKEIGNERVANRDNFIENLLKLNTKILSDNIKEIEENKQYCIHYQNKKPKIIFVSRKPYTDKFKRIEEAKKIASDIIECDYVDGKNLEIDGEYVAGLYIDDMETFSKTHELVIINEINGLDYSTCEKIIRYLKEDNEYSKMLKEYELI